MQIDVEQGSDAWLAWRKNKITGTDAGVIMGSNKFKSLSRLWEEKNGLVDPEPINQKMLDGITMEPLARQCLSGMLGMPLKPVVFEHDSRRWQGASLDGYNEEIKVACEIKCGRSAYDYACKGIVPSYYISQCQHIMSVCDLDVIQYFCYLSDEENTLIPVWRDQTYIDNLIEKEKEFWDSLQTLTPPATKYIKMDEPDWLDKVYQYKEASLQAKHWLSQEKELRESLISMSGGSNVMGGGIKMSKIVRKGQLDVQEIVKKYNIEDSESFRKPPVVSWRIENE